MPYQKGFTVNIIYYLSNFALIEYIMITQQNMILRKNTITLFNDKDCLNIKVIFCNLV